MIDQESDRGFPCFARRPPYPLRWKKVGKTRFSAFSKSAIALTGHRSREQCANIKTTGILRAPINAVLFNDNLFADEAFQMFAHERSFTEVVDHLGLPLLSVHDPGV